MNTKPKPYFTLLLMDKQETDALWCAEFGSYDFQEVQIEKRDTDLYYYRATILKSTDRQYDIDRSINKLNENLD